VNNGQVSVSLNDGSTPFLTPLAGLTGLVAYGRGNGAHIQVDSHLMLPAVLFAGDGTGASVQGGGGPTVEVGGQGGGTLQGGTGRNILIAGAGGGRLVGNSGDDVLIAGRTDFDSNLTALQAILAEWNSADSYAARVNALSGYLNSTTVHDNGVANQVDGGGARDWIFALLDGRKKDRLTGVTADDVVVGIR
jgi:hypothetical protein